MTFILICICTQVTISSAFFKRGWNLFLASGPQDKQALTGVQEVGGFGHTSNSAHVSSDVCALLRSIGCSLAQSPSEE
jgi:hypothetical protein